MADRLTPSFCCNIFFFVTAVVYSRYWDFLYDQCERLFVTELNIKHFTDKYFKRVFWVAKSYVAVYYNYFLRMAIFWT